MTTEELRRRVEIPPNQHLVSIDMKMIISCPVIVIVGGSQMAPATYAEWSKEELVKEIRKLRKRKKYGIVWEDKTEDVAELCKRELPIFAEERTREVITSKDKSMNILVEGDNYHALSVLNYTHKGAIDVIYIDPPYNTGSTVWRYNNDYVDKEDSFKHSKWVSFVYKRIKLAKNLLKNSGILVCAVDDYECHNLRHVLDELFGEENRLGTVAVVHNPGGRQDDKFFATAHEYMLVYAKNAKLARIGYLGIGESKLKEYKCEDEYGKYKLREFRRSGSNSRRKDRPKLWYPIYIDPTTLDVSVKARTGYDKVLPIDPNGVERVWRWGPKSLMDNKDKYLFVKKTVMGYTLHLKEREEDNKGEKPKTYWDKSNYSAVNGTNELKKIFSDQEDVEKIFDYPKSPYLMRDILKITTSKEATILDFFAGSGTTAQAVLELNRIDGGNRKFIICTNNEIGPKLLKQLEDAGASSEEIEEKGICRKVCYPRVKRIIEGYVYSGENTDLLFEERLNVRKLKVMSEILEEIEDTKANSSDKYDKFKIELKDNFLRLYGVSDSKGMIDGLGGNLKYFRTDFVDAELTDSNKKKLVEKSTEMLCLKEDCFEKVKEGPEFKIFTNHKGKNLGVIFDDMGIEPFKEEVRKFGRKFVVYVFSLDESAREEEFEDVEGLVRLKPIPAVILNVYRRIFG
jgi:adenine-specific DNA-methyltransferase